MKINTIAIRNYKCFQAIEIPLSPHINVVVGINSAGKSAFLEAFAYNKLKKNPHRNLSHTNLSPASSVSTFDYQFEIPGREILEYFRPNFGGIALPVGLAPNLNGDEFISYFESLDVLFDTQTYPENRAFNYARFPQVKKEEVNDRMQWAVQSYNFETHSSRIVSTGVQRRSDVQWNEIIWNFAIKNIFVFDAERYRVGECRIEKQRLLQPNAANLPACLFELHRNRRAFNAYADAVRRVLPQIKDIAVGPQKGRDDLIEILIYSVATDREELGIPLNDCGTGVAQVLAITFVALTMPGSVIVIDEPNSFLHPSASKNLMHLIKGIKNSQFIISTHSPEVISTLAPEQIISVEWDHQQGCSALSIEDGKSIETRRNLMLSLGISFSDVFGSDVAIWVEGDTEKICFDRIFDLYNDGRRPAGVEFLSMPWVSAIDVKRRNVKEFFELHRKASQGSALWPTSIAFCFDSELRTDEQKQEISRESGQRALFLPRRMVENYFLQADALAALLSFLEPAADNSREIIETWLAENQDKETYLDAPKASNTPIEFLRADRLLSDMVSQLTEARYTYDKVAHGAWLVEWILKHNPETLSELKEFVFSLYHKAVERS